VPSLIIKGKGVSPGISIGKAITLLKSPIPILQIFISPQEVEQEINRFKNSIELAKKQLFKLKEGLEKKAGKIHSLILESQLAILEDPFFLDKTTEKIKAHRIIAEWAIQETYNELAQTFNEIPEQFFRERFTDIEDVISRIQHNLQGIKRNDLSDIKEKFILIAEELTPSELAEINKEILMGIVLERGGKTSHTIILAKSLAIPAVINIEGAIKRISSDDTIIIDGYDGFVIVNPSKSQLQEYFNKRNYYIERSNFLLQLKDLPADTIDNKKITLLANIEFPEEVNFAKRSGASGIGLYRTEYIYLSDPYSLPNEEDHFLIYKRLIENAGDTLVTIRTLDLGPEKLKNLNDYFSGSNPILGLRAIRLSLKCKELFYTQLRAILRASAYGNVNILLPLISTLEEIRESKRIIEQIKEELKRRNIPYSEDIKLGAMIEVPAAALAIDLIGQEVDFLSIGTNDLVQYLLAIDRDNEKLNYLNDPLHPVVLRMLFHINQEAKKLHKPVYICGEMAADPLYIMVLVGLGYTAFSMNPNSIPIIKHLIRSISFKEAEALAQAALRKKTTAEIEELVLEKMNLLFPEGFLSHKTLKQLE